MHVSERFNQAAYQYDTHAYVQRCAGNFAFELCPEILDGTVLDIGCGTGYCTTHLSRRSTRVVALDIAPNMLKETQRRSEKIQPILADAQKLPFKDQSFSFIFSNFALQWCHVPTVLNEIKRILGPRGVFVFTLPLSGSLTEIKHAWKHVDIKPHINKFYRHKAMQIQLKQMGFTICHAQKFVLRQQFTCPLELMKSVKAIGANHVYASTAKGLLGRQKFKRLLAAFAHQKNTQGMYPLSYHIGLYKVHAKS